jgi:hypothetical protein
MAAHALRLSRFRVAGWQFPEPICPSLDPKIQSLSSQMAGELCALPYSLGLLCYIDARDEKWQDLP